jgi:hypothetical protein
VYVRKKLPERRLRPHQVVPPRVQGIPTDVIEARFRVHLDHTLRYDPAIGGVSVGNLGLGGSGTLGGLVFDANTRRDYLLSNWHVLCGRASCSPGERIIQPGTGDGDGGGSEDSVGWLGRAAITTEVDAAVAAVSGHRFALRQLLELGTVRGLREAVLGLLVSKSGRTTGLTHGVIADVDADVEVGPYQDGRNRDFVHQLVIENGSLLADRGDSGSLWVDGTGLAVGLHFAGSGDRAIANRITLVQQVLGLEFSYGVTTAQWIAQEYSQTY